GGSVDGALVWSLSRRDADGRVEVPFAVEVDGAALLAGDVGRRRLFIALNVYIVDGEGRVVAHTAQGLVLDPAVHQVSVIESGLKFVDRFVLAPGAYTLRAMVENNRTGAYFMSWTTLVVPASGEMNPQLLPPLFPDPDAPWVLARQHGGELTFALGGGTEILPAALPVLEENQPVEIYLGGGGWGDGAAAEVRIVNDVGRTVAEPVVSFSEPPVGEFQFRRAVLPPLDVPAGEYNMVVTLADEQSTEILRRSTRLIVVAEGRGRRWAGAGDSDLPRTVMERPGGTTTPEKINKKEIRSSYRQALGVLGSGDEATARRMVAELERRVAASPARNAVPALSEAELAEAMAVATQDPTVLMPIALLNRNLYRGYVARREGNLASHARKMAVTCAEQLGRARTTNGFSEGLMVNLASDLAQAGSSGAARDLLERSLELSPEFRPAMLCLGFSFERASDYFEASLAYQRVVDAHPDFDEGRLRLAINLIRTGRDGAGAQLLTGLMQGGAQTWIEIVAAQELVRLLVREGQLQEAERKVHSALERTPHDQRLWILLASILVQSGRYSEAVEAVIDLPPAGRSVSPRARYAEWPAAGSGASQAHLAAQAADAVSALRVVLDEQGGEN
ncbi:MAG: tetratricopeptide repeat protein, partial [Thermoanaerobaculales bacterium]|nr:tetratricopeptide repeat protein [Thermoanaerobaculales bacterium]